MYKAQGFALGGFEPISNLFHKVGTYPSECEKDQVALTHDAVTMSSQCYTTRVPKIWPLKPYHLAYSATYGSWNRVLNAANPSSDPDIQHCMQCADHLAQAVCGMGSEAGTNAAHGMQGQSGPYAAYSGSSRLARLDLC